MCKPRTLKTDVCITQRFSIYNYLHVDLRLKETNNKIKTIHSTNSPHSIPMYSKPQPVSLSCGNPPLPEGDLCQPNKRISTNVESLPEGPDDRTKASNPTSHFGGSLLAGNLSSSPIWDKLTLKGATAHFSGTLRIRASQPTTLNNGFKWEFYCHLTGMLMLLDGTFKR